ncbi:MAG TPA: TfoX/Sxy family protein [Jatrophihabitans sp.]|jgi:TfoX/Sxy family transcriptional regulator of competence genes
MGYDVILADRLREVLAGETAVTEKRMFGGLAFLVDGHLAVAASHAGGLLLRCDPERTEHYIARPEVSPFEMRGRELTGWLRVEAAAVDRDDDLRRWAGVGVEHARSLSPK